MTRENQIERLDAMVRGRVQGVGFRAFTVREAHKLGLTGWVRNESDGSVRVVAEGPRGDLKRFLQALYRGPRAGRVEQVDEAWADATGAHGPLSVRY